MTATKSVRLAGATWQCPCHACAFFHGEEDENRVLLPFVQDGFGANDRSFQIVDPAKRADRVRQLGSIGLDVEDAEASGRLQVATWNQAYLRGNRFDQDAMLALIQEVLGQQHEYRITRLWANMEWALEDLPGVHSIVEYESRLNYVLPKYDDVVVCTYDLTRFSAATVMDILRTHPQVIIGGNLQQNPFYLPPDQFLAELRDRNAP